MTVKIKSTVVFAHCERAVEQNKRIIIAQGGSRSGKSYNLLIWWVQKLLSEDGKTLSIVRKTLPSLKASILKDLVEVLELFGIYDPTKWHKQDGYYELPNGSIINFFSVDEPQKLRGSKRTYLYCNEANELHIEDWRQLIMRTESIVTMDYNPSEINSWIYDLEERDDAYLFLTTWRDNPYLPQSIIDEIERFKETDENYYRIYSLGERGLPTTLVFNTWHLTDKIPEHTKLLAYGIDFGYSSPNTLVAVYEDKVDNAIYLKEYLYLRNTTIPDFIYKITDLGINLKQDFYCDSAKPEAIEELRRAGLNAKPVKKNTILHGIDLIKRKKVFIYNESPNLINELNSYSWKKDKNGKIIDEPIDDNNHLLDPVRYVMEMKVGRNTGVHVY